MPPIAMRFVNEYLSPNTVGVDPPRRGFFDVSTAGM
jgi:hypothetical protein